MLSSILLITAALALDTISTSTASSLPPRTLETPCYPRAKIIKLQSTTIREISAIEVQALDPIGDNLANSIGGTATQSSTRENYYASLAVDNDTSTYSQTALGDDKAWWQLELDAETELLISTVVIQNRRCGDESDEDDCLCQLSNAELQLYDGNMVEVHVEDLGDTCGKAEVRSGFVADDKFCSASVAYDDAESGVVSHDFGAVYDAIDTAADNAILHVDSPFTLNATNLSKLDALILIETLKKETIPHQCNVVISRDIKQSDNFEKHPVVFCNFYVPIGLYCTAQIQAITCNKFTHVATGELYSNGVSSAIYIPQITEEDRLLDVYNSSYCARIDVYWESESIYDKTFPVDITYRNFETNGQYIMSAIMREDESDTSMFDGASIGLGIGVGLICGSLLTLAVIAMINGKKKDSEAECLTNEVEEGKEVL